MERGGETAAVTEVCVEKRQVGYSEIKGGSAVPL